MRHSMYFDIASGNTKVRAEKNYDAMSLAWLQKPTKWYLETLVCFWYRKTFSKIVCLNN